MYKEVRLYRVGWYYLPGRTGESMEDFMEGVVLSQCFEGQVEDF